jgi:hypothetical protein
MDPVIASYLSLQYESKEEEDYLQGLLVQYSSAIDSGSFHMALFAYHLLFMSFVYQTIHKIKIWMPEKFKLALVTFGSDKKKEFLESISPWTYSALPERTIFGLLHILEDCDDLVADCKGEIVDYRNSHLGHANPIIVGEEEFYKKVEQYDAIALRIQQLTHAELARVFSEFLSSRDSSEALTKDDIELGIIVPNRSSDKDLECFAADCHLGGQPIHKQAIDLLKDEFGVDVSFI